MEEAAEEEGVEVEGEAAVEEEGGGEEGARHRQRMSCQCKEYKESPDR